MAAMVDSYPRTTEIPQFFPEDPGDVVKPKPTAYQRFDSEPSPTTPDASSSYSAHSREHSLPQTPTTPTEVKPKPTLTAVPVTRQDSKPEIQVLPNLEDPQFEDSTTEILRHYNTTGNGRPASFHLNAAGRPREEPAMSDIFRVAGKECMVTLEDDLVKWSRRLAPGKQSGEL